MSQAIKVGIFAAVVLVALGLLIMRIEEIELFADDERRIDALFDSVAGLDDKAPVRVAGVRVGRVDGINLAGQRARVTLLLEQPVELGAGSRAAIASTGLLGDKYVSLIPAPPGAPPLADDAVLEGETPVTFDTVMARLERVGSNIERFTGTLAGAEGEENQISRLLGNLEAISADVRDLLADNRDEVTATMANFEAASATLARELPRIALRMEEVLAEVSSVVGENRAEIRASAENLRRVTAALEPAVANLGTISARLAAGEGTIGKLLNSEETHDQLISTLESVEGGVDSLSETLGAIQRIQLDLGLEGFYLDALEESQASFRLDFATRSPWLYRVAVVDPATPDEKVKLQRIAVTNPDGSEEVTTIETLTREDKMQLSVLLGRELPRSLVLRTGLIESSFGVQADYPLFDDKMWLTFEAFDFNREENVEPHLRLSTRWRLHPNVYLLGGYDDFLASDRDSLFLGAGIRWKDDDLKYLLGAAPSF